MSKKNLTLLILLITLLIPYVDLQGQNKKARKQFDLKRDEFVLNNYYISLGLNNLLTRYTGILEWKVDSLMHLEKNPEINQRLLILKYNLINVVSKTTFHTDPLAGGIDSWLLGMQLTDYFRDPDTRAYYGENNSVVLIDLHERFTEQFDKALKEHIKPENYQKIIDYSKEHPVEDRNLNRASIVPLMSEWLSANELKLKTGLLTMTDLVRELTNRMEFYAKMVPKQTMWHMEHSMREALKEDSIVHLFEDTQRLLKASADLLEKSEAMIDHNRDTVLHFVNRQRIAAMNGITIERQEAMEALASERAIVLEAMQMERLAMQAFMAGQREAMMADMQNLMMNSMNHSVDIGKELVDYIFYKMLIGFGILFIAFFAGFYFLKKR